MANMKDFKHTIAPVIFDAGTSLSHKESIVLREFLKYVPKSAYKEAGERIHFKRRVELSIVGKIEVRYGDIQ